MIKRDVSIDVLRSIGLLCIILAHVSAPKFVLQIRNFDVPLMAFIMGISFYLTNKNKHFNLIEYSKKRFKRLLFPTWKFLTIFFTFFYFFSLFNQQHFHLQNIKY
ncbi:acyltransferase family protein [Globicatella sanguinis]